MHLQSLIEKGAKPVGCVVFGGPIVDPRPWIDQARKDGYLVLICDGYAELYR